MYIIVYIYIYIYVSINIYIYIYIICEELYFFNLQAITQNLAFAQFKHEISALLTGGKSQQLGINSITWDN